MGEFGKTLLYVGGGAWILFLAVMLWPVLRFYRLTTERMIAAAPDRVWAIYDTNLNDPESKALYDQVLSSEQTDGDPPVVTSKTKVVVAGQLRHAIVRYAVLQKRPSEIMSVRVLSIDDKIDPYGPQNISTTEFFPDSGGTRLRHIFEGEIRTLGQRLAL